MRIAQLRLLRRVYKPLPVNKNHRYPRRHNSQPIATRRDNKFASILQKERPIYTKTSHCAFIMSSPSKAECELKAGHPPAVKAGGMRITQHKTPKETPGINEDTTGLKISGSPPKTVSISGAPVKGNADFPAEAVQSFHKEKPPAQHASKPHINIQQPRK